MRGEAPALEQARGFAVGIAAHAAYRGGCAPGDGAGGEALGSAGDDGGGDGGDGGWAVNRRAAVRVVTPALLAFWLPRWRLDEGEPVVGNSTRFQPVWTPPWGAADLPLRRVVPDPWRRNLPPSPVWSGPFT